MSRPIPIGIDDFRELRQGGLEYIDKSMLIRELIDRAGAKIVLLPRPRRFGKSLNLSMLRYFFEKSPQEDRWPLFADLEIARAGEPYQQEFARYPVVHLSFKGTRAETFELCRDRIRNKLRGLYQEHRALLDEARLDEWETSRFRAIIDGSASEVAYGSALLDLTGYLHRTHGVPAVVLIDEYDEPIHSAFLHGYEAPILDFFRAFFIDGLKGNPHLHRGVLTGILRVARESIFSGLNNLGVYTVLSTPFSACFGFTEAEVAALLERAGAAEMLDAVRSYYNGYLFGDVPMYNPWSILNFLDNPTRELKPYWVSTSANDLVRELLQIHTAAIGQELEIILAGGFVEKKLDEHVVLAALREDPDALYSLLVFTGYLKADRDKPIPMQPPPPYRLSIPNQEVAEVYRSTFKHWMELGLKRQGGAIRRLLKAVLEGDAPTLELELQALAGHVISYHDVGPPDPERFHHGLMLGLLASLEPDYHVLSNREAGGGRPDVIIRPHAGAQSGKAAVVLELKAARRGQRTLKQALAEGIRQLRERDYAAALHAEGFATVHALSIAFDGKTARVATAEAKATRTKKK